MPRLPRKKSKTGIYHIIIRGVNRQLIFEDTEDKTTFLGILLRFIKANKFELYCYCLMDNHVHLLVKEKDDPVSQIVKRISASYVHWYNKKYERCGHLFQERFKSEPVENRNYFIRVIRYIHQNPLKAGLAQSVFECEWTSIHEYTKKEQLINTARVFNLFSKKHTEAITLFNEYMQQSSEDNCLEDYAKKLIPDSEVISILKEWGFPNATILQRLEKENRNSILAKLKTLDGVTIQQISRVTGISKSVIQRA
ncbi:MAG: transposase [Cytobacillus gottheilii]|uniref:transposase n=1 Tax=Cytobacillus gottheilii TaxID=859144 RepID=UPI0034649595